MEERILLLLEFGMKLVMFRLGLEVLFGGKVKRIWIGGAAYIVFVFIVLCGHMSLDNLLGILWVIMTPLQFIMVTPPDDRKYGWIAERFFFLCYIEEFVGMLVRDFSEYQWKSATDNEIDAISNLITVLIICLACFIRRLSGNVRNPFGHEKRLRYIRTGMLAAVGFVAMEIVWCVVALDYVISKLQNDNYYFHGKVVSLLSMLGIGVLFLFVFYIKNSNEKMEQLIGMEKTLQQQQSQYYEALLQKEQDTRDYRHDMSGHLICLKEYADAGDMEKVRAYIDGMQANMVRAAKSA